MQNVLLGVVSKAVLEKESSSTLEMIKFLLDLGAQVSTFSLQEAVFNRKPNILKLLCPANPNRYITSYAAEFGSLECLEYFLSICDNPIEFEAECMNITVRNGHLDVLKHFVDVRKTKLDLPHLRTTACFYGKVEILKYLIESFGIENFIADEFYRLLLPTSTSGQLKILKYLVEELSQLIKLSIDWNKSLDYGRVTVLYNAVENDRFEIVQYLIEKGADVGFRSISKNETALMKACELRRFKIVKFLLELKEIDVNQSDNNGKSPLFIASQFGYVEVAKLLLQHKNIKVDKPNLKSQTPLHVAFLHCRFEIVKLLVEYGANIEKADRYGNTALMIDTRPHPAIAQYLVSKGANIHACNKSKQTPLMIAAKMRNFENVKFFVNSGANLNSIDKWNRSALMFAISAKNNFQSIKYLVASKCDIKLKNVANSNALMLACQQKDFDSVKLLIEKGSDLNDVNLKGNSALHIAIHSRNSQIVNLLIDSGADVYQRNLQGETPFFVAVRNRIFSDVKFFVENKSKIDFNSPRNDGTTPLHFVCEHYDDKMVRLLVETFGANVNAKDVNGETPLFFSSSLQIVKCLVDLGVDANLKNNKDETAAAKLTQKFKNSEVQEFLLSLNKNK